jgi:hypothetical protein
MRPARSAPNCSKWWLRSKHIPNQGLGAGVLRPGRPPREADPPTARIPPMSFWRRDYFFPLALVVVGVFILLHNLNYLNWLDGKYFWPVVLIVLGVFLIARRTRA